MQKKYDELKALIVSNLNIFNMHLLSSRDFAQYASKLKFNITEPDVNSLWSSGLLKSDLITSDKKLNINGIELVKFENSLYYYVDNREIVARENWADSLPKEVLNENKLHIYFHRFRIIIIDTIFRSFKYSFPPLQYLYNEKGASEIVQIENKRYSNSSKGLNFSGRIIWINNYTTLAVCCAPSTHEQIYDEIDCSNADKPECHKNDYRNILEKILIDIGVDEIEKIRKHICVMVEYLDSNKMLHILLRMTNGRMRKSLEGHIGASMLLFSMAESLRLVTEQAFNITLPEEDELGFVGWVEDVKSDVFGATRLFDANPGVKREYIRQCGVDFGTKIRCYLEGETEIGAFKSVVASSSLIDFINLKGKVYEKGVSSFRDSLRLDIKNKVLSVVVIDSDREDYVRAIRKACQDDHICGRVFFLEPDFEFGNFTIDELIEIVKKIALERGVKNSDLHLITDSAKNCKSGKDFEAAIRNSIPELSDIGKGEAWGTRLMDFANHNPVYPPEHLKQGERILIEIKNFLIRFTTQFCSHELTLKGFKIDPKDGRLIRR